MRQRAPLPSHELVIEHAFLAYLHVQVDAKTRDHAVRDVEQAIVGMKQHAEYLAMAYRAVWEVHVNQMRLVDGIPGDMGDTNGSPTHAGNVSQPTTESRLLAALAGLAAAHSDTNTITDHASHDTDTNNDCAICAAFDVLMEEGQAALEERRQAYDDLQERYDVLQARYATLEAAHTRLQEEHGVLTERHEALSTAYYSVSLAQFEDADRDRVDPSC